MFTRGEVVHPSVPARHVNRVALPGAVRVTVVNGIAHTWAITRPSTFPDPTNAPFYVDYGYSPNLLAHGGSLALTPARPRVEMDPSDPSTWQRQYRFDG